MSTSPVVRGTGHARGGVWPYLQLTRPANLVTAAADILAGYAAAGRPSGRSLALLVLSSVCLYAGGVVMNDVFDSKLDAVERPERPIPSGRARRKVAAALGIALQLSGVGAALAVSPLSGDIAALIFGIASLYSAVLKHNAIAGPIGMATCRGLNLLLGVSAVPGLVAQRWYVGAISFIYIAAITLLSAGEVHGGRRGVSVLALNLVGVALVGVVLLGRTPAFGVLAALPFLIIFGGRVLPAFWRACVKPESATVRRAVKTGVLSLIFLDSALAAGYAGILFGLGVMCLWLVSGKMAELFAVT